VRIKYVLSLSLLTASLLNGCAAVTEEPPGVGVKAERGYSACRPIIESLEAYHAANGEYPAALADLVPGTIAALPDQVNGAPIVYVRTSEGYTLSFSYIGPGMNFCTYSTDAGREWRCTGAY
jgi:hypothetical protein